MNTNQDKPMTAEEVAFEVWKQHSLSGKTFRNTTFEDFKEHELYVWVVKAMETYASQSRSPCLPMQWRKASVVSPTIGDYYYCKVDCKNDGILKTIVEWGEHRNGEYKYYDWDLKNVQHFPGFKEEAEVIEWLDETASGEQYRNQVQIGYLQAKEDKTVSIVKEPADPDRQGQDWKEGLQARFPQRDISGLINYIEQHILPHAGYSRERVREIAEEYASWYDCQPSPCEDASFNNWCTTFQGKRLLANTPPTPSAQPEDRVKQLEQWKREAISVMPDFQAIGKALNVPLAQSVHDKILPGIIKLKDRVKELEAVLTELVALKQHKDTNGKTPDYEERQPKAWEAARKVLMNSVEAVPRVRRNEP